MCLRGSCLVVVAIYCCSAVAGLKLYDTAIVEGTSDTVNSDTFIDLNDTTHAGYDFNSTQVASRLLPSLNVVALGQYPFVVYITSTLATGASLCSGALIAADYVLTLATCVHGASDITVSAATITTVEVAPNAPIVRTGTAIVYPKFSGNNVKHNIALVNLAVPFPLGTNINTILLATRTKELHGKGVRVFGYGGDTVPLISLRMTYMNVMDKSSCKEVLKTRNLSPSSSQSCLDTDRGKVGMCTAGDRGGPVTFRHKDESEHTLVGLLSYFYQCGSSVPNLFIRVRAYLDFIREHVPNAVNSG